MRVSRVLIAGAVLMGAAGTLLLHLDGRVLDGRVASAPSAESEACIVSASWGGTVEAVLVQAGESVTKGQMLVRLHPTEMEEHLRTVALALDRASPQVVATAGGMVGRISPRLWHELIVTDPALLAAEREYADAAEAAQTSNSAEAQARLRRAAAGRRAMQQRVGQLRPGTVEDLGALYGQIAHEVRWLQAQREAAEVRSPIDGVVEILDLHRGDAIGPAGRVALIASAAAKAEAR